MNDQADFADDFIRVHQSKGKTILVLAGRWTMENAAVLEHTVDRVLGQESDYQVDAEGIEGLDTSGALVLKKLEPERHGAKLTEPQRALLDFLPAFSPYQPPEKPAEPLARRAVSRVGKATIGSADFVWDIFILVGRVSVSLASNIAHPKHWRVPSITRHVKEAGIDALLIIGLLAILISMVITYQGVVQLRKFGADIFTIDLMVIALLREMGVLVTAIMVAGRSGSAFAAEIGVMTLRDEVSALKTMGVDPIEVLVAPRVLALLITLPLLTFLADLIGLAGGALMAASLLGTSLEQYIERVAAVATPTMFLVGIIKAPVFAFAIAVIGCYQGLQVHGSAESIGRRTTLAVVQSIFVVILADGLFSMLFAKVGI